MHNGIDVFRCLSQAISVQRSNVWEENNSRDADQYKDNGEYKGSREQDSLNSIQAHVGNCHKAPNGDSIAGKGGWP